MLEYDLSKLRVSDHALVRYMERIKGVCLDSYREEILRLVAENRQNPSPPAGRFDEGAVIVIEILGLPVITTILGSGQRPKYKTAFTQMIYFHPPTLRGDDDNA